MVLIKTQQSSRAESLPKAIIVDIDGTLAHAKGRRWDEFAEAANDEVDEVVAGIVRTYSDLGHLVLVTSARPDAYRRHTSMWLAINSIPSHDLFMRRRDDANRPDAEVKEDIYHEFIKGKFDVEFVLDDRNSVVEMWRRLGLKCLQVGDGDF